MTIHRPHRLAGTPITAALSDQSSPLLKGAAVTPIGATSNRTRARGETVHGPTGEAGAPNLSTSITADASKMSGLAFMDATGMSSPEKRAERKHRDQQACIRAIRRGDTYGFPPAMVAECKRIMADQPDFDQVGWGLAERSAYGMPKGGAL